MIAAIELAMLARLKDVGPALGINWKTLTTYPDDWDAYLLSQGELRGPSAWVVFAGWNSPERNSEDQLTVLGSFGLMVAAENMRPNEQYQRHGGADQASEPGSYHLVLAAVSALTGQTLGLDLAAPFECGALRPVRPSEAMRQRKLSMYAVEFTCRFPIVLVGDGESDPAELLALHANWDVPAIGDPIPVDRDLVADGAQLPDDPHADATDHLVLGED